MFGINSSAKKPKYEMGDFRQNGKKCASFGQNGVKCTVLEVTSGKHIRAMNTPLNPTYI